MREELILAAVFGLNQFGFIFVRTLNVRAVAAGHIPLALLSGTGTYLMWILGIVIGSVSMYEIVTEFKWENIPIVLAGLIGGLIGTFWGMKFKKSKPT